MGSSPAGLVSERKAWEILCMARSSWAVFEFRYKRMKHEMESGGPLKTSFLKQSSILLVFKVPQDYCLFLLQQTNMAGLLP